MGCTSMAVRNKNIFTITAEILARSLANFYQKAEIALAKAARAISAF